MKKDSVKVYFEELGKTIPVTLRMFDRLLHDNSIVWKANKWVCL